MENKGDLVLFSDFSRRGIPRFARNDGVFGMVPRRSEKRRQAAALKKPVAHPFRGEGFHR
jgi:hypothetical protein